MRIRVPEITGVIVLLAAGVACGGAQPGPTKSKVPPPPPRMTRATLVGPLCDTDHCRCRSDGGDPGLPEEEGLKRYEVVVGPTDNELWVTLDDMTFYKDREQATRCFYVDLRPGEHPVTVRASAGDEPAFAARMSISEGGEGGWYDTFDFGCGGPGVCSFDMLDDWKEGLSRYPRNIHDPCGSTKIVGLTWDTSTAPDRMHPSELLVSLALKIYEFPPEHPPGHPECKNNY